MAKAPDAFVYNATLERIVDGDTFDCSLDLGFDVKFLKKKNEFRVHTNAKQLVLSKEQFHFRYSNELGFYFTIIVTDLGNWHSFFSRKPY